MHKTLLSFAAVAVCAYCTPLAAKCLAQAAPAVAHPGTHTNPTKPPQTPAIIPVGIAANSVCIQNNYNNYTLVIHSNAGGADVPLPYNHKTYIAIPTSVAGPVAIIIWVNNHKPPVYKFSLLKGHCYQVGYDKSKHALAAQLL